MAVISRHDVTLDVDDNQHEAMLRVNVGGGWTAAHTLDLRGLPVRPVGPVAYSHRGRRRRKVEPVVVRDGALSGQVRQWAGEMIYQYMQEAREALVGLVEIAAAMQEDAAGHVGFVVRREEDAGMLSEGALRSGARESKTRKQAALDLRKIAGAAHGVTTVDDYKPMSRAGRPPTITASSIATATKRASRKLKASENLTDQKIADAHDPPLNRTHLNRRRAELRRRGQL